MAPAAAALFGRAYLRRALPALQQTIGSNPRLHSLWAYLLAFLLPGFHPSQVRRV